MKLSYPIGLIPVLLMSNIAFADTVAVENKLKQLYPNTRFESVKPTPMSSIYEVSMGQNIAYVQENGRYFIFGALYDMQAQKDLTAERKAALERTAFKDLPFKNAFTIKKGKGGQGKREFALFSDPDCPFCRRLEETLAGMTDYTVHVFLYPIAALHPTAISKAEHIWCTKNKEKAWNDYMLLGRQPESKSCSNPVADNIKLASDLGIRGTPSMIHKDGRRTSGAMPRAQLERWVNGE